MNHMRALDRSHDLLTSAGAAETRRIEIEGHETDVTLEPAIWQLLGKTTGREGLTMSRLLSDIARITAGDAPLEPAIRTYALMALESENASAAVPIQDMAKEPYWDQATYDGLMALGERWSKLPVLDDRPPDEILGYDENGLPS